MIEKIKNWLKNPYNLALVGIIALGFAIRLYFFIKTSNQTLWYDEGDYMSTAKHWAFGYAYHISSHRPPLFMAIAAIFFYFGINEALLKFIIILIPSTALIYCVYLLGKEMYDEKIGLIAGFFIALSWTLVFWTNRFQPDFLSMCFQVLIIYFMWKYWKTNETKYAVISGICTALGFLFKLSAILVPMAFMVFIFIKERFAAFKNKAYYYYSASFLICLVPYFIWSQIALNTPFSFTTGYGVNTNLGIGWHVINFLYILSQNITFILFVVGAILALKFLLYLDKIVKEKNKCMEFPGLFVVISIIVVLAWYIFWIRAAEDRWVFLWLPFMFILAGNAIVFIYNLIKKYSKILSVIVVVGLLLTAGYMQFKTEKNLIENKKDSYLQVKEAAIWMKENSNADDKIFSISYPQTSYYSEREVLTSMDIEGINDTKSFEEFLQREKPRYIELSVFETHPQWLYDWSRESIKLTPVQAFFADNTQKQALLVVYEKTYE